MRALGVVMLLVLSLGGAWAATQYVAAGLHDAPELGPPWATLGDVRIYPPWGWGVWAGQHPSRSPTLLRNASAIATLSALAGAAMAAVAALRRAPSAASGADGSSRWATTLELRKAGLLRDAGLVLCQTGDARFRTRVDGAEKAYGPHHSILDNCHIRLAYAANDDRTARRTLRGDPCARSQGSQRGRGACCHARYLNGASPAWMM
jgi:type IV secretion system protein VirD4